MNLVLRVSGTDGYPDSPIELIVGAIFLYSLLGVSCFVGLAVTCLFLPLNHFASKVVVSAQDNLMKARDERVSLMNEVGTIDDRVAPNVLTRLCRSWAASGC